MCESDLWRVLNSTVERLTAPVKVEAAHREVYYLCGLTPIEAGEARSCAFVSEGTDRYHRRAVLSPKSRNLREGTISHLSLVHTSISNYAPTTQHIIGVHR